MTSFEIVESFKQSAEAMKGQGGNKRKGFDHCQACGALIEAIDLCGADFQGLKLCPDCLLDVRRGAFNRGHL